MVTLEDDMRSRLRRMQRTEKDKRRYVKITVLLMLDLGFSVSDTAAALGVDDATVYRYAEQYRTTGNFGDYMQDKYVRYEGKLTAEQEAELDEQLQHKLCRTAKEVAAVIEERFSVKYTPAGVVALLKRLGFVYKKTTLVGSKADSSQQEAFLAEMQELLEGCKHADVVYFSDAVHPQHNTRASYGWIKSGKSFQVQSNTGRERLNINAAVNAHDVCDIVVREDERINAESTIALYEQLQEHHPEGSIHVICDNAKYYRSRVVKEWVEQSRIVQVFLPSYSPNLNLIERLWRFFRKKVTDTEFYPTKEKFRDAVRRFFNDIEQHRSELESLLTLNFHVA
jgi:transposase